MNKKGVDDYIQEGIHGVKELKPDERRKFLGTIRERVVVALTKSQVREEGTYKEVEELMKTNKDAKLYLNGTMNYTYLSDYIKLANKTGSNYIISTNKEHSSDLGLVLAHDEAVDIENIYISNQTKEDEQEEENQFLNFFKKLF